MTHSYEIAEAIPALPQPAKSARGQRRVGDTMVIREQRFSFNQVRQALGGVLNHDLHAKRVDSRRSSIRSRPWWAACLPPGIGYEDLNDHDELRKDPMFAVLASTSSS